MKKLFALLLITCSFLQGLSQQQEAMSDAPLCLSDTSRWCYLEERGINPDSIYCYDLYCEVLDWLGVKYRYGEGTKQGTDCSSLASNITRHTMEYDLSGSSSSIFESCEKIEKEALQEGDLVFFKISKSRVSHMGIYLQNGKFVHASVKGGVMINDLEEPYYKKHYAGGGRPR